MVISSSRHLIHMDIFLLDRTEFGVLPTPEVLGILLAQAYRLYSLFNENSAGFSKILPAICLSYFVTLYVCISQFQFQKSILVFLGIAQPRPRLHVCAATE